MKEKIETEIDLTLGAPCMCKIRLIGQRPPLVIKINYLSGLETSNLTMYGSFKWKEPSSDNNEFFRTGTPNKLSI